MYKMNGYSKTINICFNYKEAKEKPPQLVSSSSFSSNSLSDFNYKPTKQNQDCNTFLFSDSEIMNNLDNYRLKSNKLTTTSNILKPKNLSLDFDVSKFKNKRALKIPTATTTIFRANSPYSYSKSLALREYEIVPSDIQNLPCLQTEINDNKGSYESIASIHHFLLRGIKKDLNRDKIEDLDYKCYYGSQLFEDRYGFQKIPKENNKENEKSDLFAYWYKSENSNVYTGFVNIDKKAKHY